MHSEGKPCYAFINSLGTDLRIWHDVANLLRPHGCILLFDKAGHGLSDEPTDDWMMRSYADDLIQLLDRLSIDKISLIGLSIGGMIAMEFAIHYPDRLKRLILCDTGPRIGTQDSWNDRISIIDKNGIAFMSETIMTNWFSADFRERRPEQVRGYQNMLEKTSVNGYLTACRCIRDTDLLPDLENILSATLCLCGSEDRSTPPAEMQKLAACIDQAQYAEIAGAGHLPCIEFPSEFADQILNFK
jgi:3-oxoadipate enol-lactonase